MENQNNRLRLFPFVSSSEISYKKYKSKSYTHFDRKISFKRIEHKITDPCWVAQHGFFPFIHFTIKYSKYNKEKEEKKSKIREIYYASHVDSFIYKYYGDILNNHYNEKVNKLGISDVATAYRNNLSGKSNINFAKEVIDFISAQTNAFIYVADFTNFFDNLDHKYLKEKMKSVLEVETLPEDFYAVFKNITKFSYIEKDAINQELTSIYGDKVPRLTRYFDEKKFRDFKKNTLEKNELSFGIPQGAGISSVFSNIYLLEFDRLLNELAEKYKGLYRRYCDDLIIVIPIDDLDQYKDISVIDNIDSIRKTIPNLIIQEEKTERYIYNNGAILDINNNPSKLDYLGFSFDGEEVKIREKSLFKYYSRAYKKVKLCNKLTKKSNQKAQRRSLFKNYTHLGKSGKGHGNFLSYASRAQRIFDEDSNTTNLMRWQVKNHWKKINKRLEEP